MINRPAIGRTTQDYRPKFRSPFGRKPKRSNCDSCFSDRASQCSLELPDPASKLEPACPSGTLLDLTNYQSQIWTTFSNSMTTKVNRSSVPPLMLMDTLQSRCCKCRQLCYPPRNRRSSQVHPKYRENYKDYENRSLDKADKGSTGHG